MTSRRPWTAILLLALMLATLVPAVGLEGQAEDTSFTQFKKAIDEYLLLHRRLENEAPPLVPGANPIQIHAASDVLAGAIQRARPKARQGDFFTAGVSHVLTARMREVVDPETFKRMLATLTDEPIATPAPRIHMRSPNVSPLATMPAHVLLVLPELPEELEYRFVRGDLILRDRHASLIIDYIPKVLPASEPRK